MLNRCKNCGNGKADKIVSDDGNSTACPKCGYIQKIKRLPLFIITGASGVGKSTISRELFENEQDYVVMESDILWNDIYNTPDDDYRRYREVWLRLCKNISQAGKPVVLCGCSTPKQFENCLERRYFTDIYYIAIVCDNSKLENRLRNGRNVNDENWINGSVSFNNWLKENADKTSPAITLLDTTNLSIEEATKKVDEWIHINL